MSSKAKEAKSTNGPPRLTTWSSLPVRQQNSLHARQETAVHADRTTAVKGKGKGKVIANPDSGPDDSGGSDHHDYKSTSMTNGTVNGHRKKGTGKSVAPMADGFVDTEEEDLYS